MELAPKNDSQPNDKFSLVDSTTLPVKIYPKKKLLSLFQLASSNNCSLVNISLTKHHQCSGIPHPPLSQLLPCPLQRLFLLQISTQVLPMTAPCNITVYMSSQPFNASSIIPRHSSLAQPTEASFSRPHIGHFISNTTNWIWLCY